VQACQVLAGAGFTNLTNVLGGYGGSRTGDTGWIQAGLPVEQQTTAGADYESLRQKRGAR
jgi:hypothetical protein